MTTHERPVHIAASDWHNSAGVETLRRMASVDRYNTWIAKTIQPYLGTRILEVGCGIGNMTPYWADAESVTCLDVLAESVAHTREIFGDRSHIRTLLADIADPTTVERLGASAYDTAICINVLEHIEDDRAALRHMLAALEPGGRLLLFVPAGSYLFGTLDRALHHFRRYERRALTALITEVGFRINEARYMNVAGIPGWFLSSRVLRRTVPPHGLLSLFNALTPVFRWAEARCPPPIGQSLVVIAQRPPAS